MNSRKVIIVVYIFMKPDVFCESKNLLGILAELCGFRLRQPHSKGVLHDVQTEHSCVPVCVHCLCWHLAPSRKAWLCLCTLPSAVSTYGCRRGLARRSGKLGGFQSMALTSLSLHLQLVLSLFSHRTAAVAMCSCCSAVNSAGVCFVLV